MNKADIQIGVSSNFWKILEATFLEYLSDIHLQFENPENSYEDYLRLSGNAKSIRECLAAPHRLLLALEDPTQDELKED